MKKIIITILALLAIIGGIFGVTKVKEVYEEQQQQYICLYGCPSVKRKIFRRKEK